MRHENDGEAFFPQIAFDGLGLAVGRVTHAIFHQTVKIRESPSRLPSHANSVAERTRFTRWPPTHMRRG